MKPLAFLILFAMAGLSPARAANAVEETSFQGRKAFRLSNGQDEAIVVPEFSGRVMRYGEIGGANWLWNAPTDAPAEKGFRNWGGNKTFIGPHGLWRLFAEEIWPPRPEWDGGAHDAQVLPDGRLRVTAAPWSGFEARIVREFRFDANGDFVIEQTLEKNGGSPLFLSIWNVSQAAQPDAVFLPLNPASAYANGYHAFGPLTPGERSQMVPSGELLRITPGTGAGYKIGLDSLVASVAVVKGRTVWIARTARFTKGNYPDGAEGAGFPVEFYNHGKSGSAQYVEIELLSPLHRFEKGIRHTQMLRWSLHALPEGDLDSPSVLGALRKWLWQTTAEEAKSASNQE